MKFRKNAVNLTFAVVGAGLAFAAAPAFAEDLFQGLGTVSGQELAEQRGGEIEISEDALAVAVGLQHQNATISSGDVGAGGTINFGEHTFAHQVMSLNVINSGNNNVIQAHNVIAVTVVNGAPLP